MIEREGTTCNRYKNWEITYSISRSTAIVSNHLKAGGYSEEQSSFKIPCLSEEEKVSDRFGYSLDDRKTTSRNSQGSQMKRCSVPFLFRKTRSSMSL